jgi:hypothetical protein
MKEIIKLIEETKFMEAVNLLLALPEDYPETKALWKALAEASAREEKFQISEYAWTRCAGIRIRMTLIPKS